MHLIQKVRDLLDLINNDKCLGRITEKALPELLRMLFETSSYIGFEQVNVNRFGETLFQKS